MTSREARFAVYLVDPGPDLPAVTLLIQEIAGVAVDEAAEVTQEFPAVISFFETEAEARGLARRFSDLKAVAVVRPANQPLAPAPIEQVSLDPTRKWLRMALLALGVLQLALAGWWIHEGNYVGGSLGLLLALYVLLYFGRQRW